MTDYSMPLTIALDHIAISDSRQNVLNQMSAMVSCIRITTKATNDHYQKLCFGDCFMSTLYVLVNSIVDYTTWILLTNKTIYSKN